MNKHTNATTDHGPAPHGTGPHTWLQRLAKPRTLFSVVAALVLAVIWATALFLIQREYAAADRAARALTRDVADTYEAQVIRALREIDHTLKLVRHEFDNDSPAATLQRLDDNGLLPPALLFTVAITDAEGNVIASNGDGEALPAIRDIAPRLRPAGSMTVGPPRRDAADNEWRLAFARPLFMQSAEDGSAVSVSVSVHAGYFVSGYDRDALGEHGVLGLLGTDGVFRARRTGDSLAAGGRVDYDALASSPDRADSTVSIERNPWDDVRRYTIARQLYGFPLAIVIGLSQHEQLAGARELQRTYLLRASGVSVLALIVIALLGRVSGRLRQARQRMMEERIEHARQVEYLAFHDNLTDLPNRAFFTHLLTQQMQQSRRYDRHLALLFLDLDRFKTINDSLGHEAGDELLREVARRLSSSVRQSDIVARLGGDEFVVLLPEIHSGNQVTPVADKILAAVGRPFTLAGQEFRVTVSIGITMFPDDGEDEQTLVKNADVAMYHAKAQGKNNYQFYSSELNANTLERLALESSLRSALERDEFRLFYQAKRDMTTGRITGMEALLRWQHPELGLILPMQFVPLAEETGLIVPIGRWVLRTACAQNVAWQDQGFPPLRIAVNLSARQFIDEELLDDIKRALHETGMAPGLLEIEITESMVMKDMEKTISILNDLKEMGVHVAIDDFGTGYSSLSTLKQFPLDTIKIDGSFIRDVADNLEDKGLTEAIVAVGRSLSLTVVAEGVETTGQFDFLRTHACDEFQGFYDNKPMPADEFARVLQEWAEGMNRDEPGGNE